MTTTTTVLVAARAKIASGWTQGAMARDADGEPCSVMAVKAVAWCSDGAVKYAAEDDAAWWEALKRLSAAAGLRDSNELIIWQDVAERTHAEMLELFDRAIAAEACWTKPVEAHGQPVV